MSGFTTAFIGAGNMSRGIIGGLIANGGDLGSISASNPGVGPLDGLRKLGLSHTAIAGSAPAYFFQFMEAMIAEAQRMGLDEESARTLCAQTCVGAGRMLAEGDVDAAELRRRVCSPNGATELAVAAFSAADLEQVVSKAMQDCYARSEEIGRELS